MKSPSEPVIIDESVTTAPQARSAFAVIIPLIVVGTLLALFAGGLAYAYTQEQAYPDRIYPGVRIDHVDVGGLRPEEALTRVNTALNEESQAGLSFIVASTTLLLPSDQFDQIVGYTTDETVQRAYAIGHSPNRFQRLLQILSVSLHQKQLAVTVNHFNGELIEKWLASTTVDLLPGAQDARLSVLTATSTSTTAPQITILPEQVGQTIDLKTAVNDADLRFWQRSFEPIIVRTIPQEPGVRASDLLPLQAKASTWLSHPPFKMTHGTKSWTVSSTLLAPWLTATGTETLVLGIDETRLSADISPWVSSELQPARAGSLSVENGALKDFIAPAEGISVDTHATAQALLNVLNQASSTAPISLVRETPPILGASAAELGIQEVIGIGSSIFSGSPSNRRRNIAIGAEHVNGSLVPPDGEFSLLKTLGPIDGAHHWLPELVIKGNKTTPEFGGGLCQVGTTVFRGAMDAGLLITERQNHSYRVVYYEPAGTDATIYDPAPDFKFKNDTGHWVLITSHLAGDTLRFTFWGTKDGRTVAPRVPTISNIVAPPPKKMVPTTDLPVGKIKCTESAHAGATAKLDYVVTYPSGDVKKTVFNSYYKPWGAVCLVGVETLSATAPTVDETGVNNPN